MGVGGSQRRGVGGVGGEKVGVNQGEYQGQEGGQKGDRGNKEVWGVCEKVGVNQGEYQGQGAGGGGAGGRGNKKVFGGGGGESKGKSLGQWRLGKGGVELEGQGGLGRRWRCF